MNSIFLRCKINGLDNDTYEITDSYHSQLIDKYIPLQNIETSVRESYDTCHYRKFLNESQQEPFIDSDNQIRTNLTDFVLVKCTQFVYSKKYFVTTTSHVIFNFF